MFPTADSEDISQVTSQHTNSQNPSSDEPKSTAASQVAQYTEHRESFMMLLLELVFCLVLALSTYGALHNSPAKVSKQPIATRFFSRDSIVADWYRGHLSPALTAINRADVSFVMYYAPWDAECQHVRWEFEKAAAVLSDRVHFSAINCWNPGSECRLQHSKIPSWPIIMAYTVTSRGILYKGPRDAPSMINFLELIMRPMRRVANTEDLVSLLSVCDAVAVGYTSLAESAQHYHAWYHVSLQARESDTLGEICFAAVTSGQLARDLGVGELPAARLMLWNHTRVYRGESWNETQLLEWVLDKFRQPVARVMPMWRKAFSFERHVDGSPVLVLFTPLNALYEQIPNYALLREVAMEYYNCPGNESSKWITEIMRLQQVQRLLYQQRDIKKFCQEYKFKKAPKPRSVLYKKELVSHHNKYPLSNVTEKNQKNGLFDFLVARGIAISKAIEGTGDDAAVLSSLGLLECTSIFPAEKGYYENEQCQRFEESVQLDRNMLHEEPATSMLPLEDDPLSAENLIQDNIRHYCELMRFAFSRGAPVAPARDQGAPAAPRGSRGQGAAHITGLACEKNFSLNMIAVDSVRNHHFAESLGIDIRTKKDMTAVVILDSKHETQHVLSSEYSARSVREFIRQYTHGRLARTLRSHVPRARHTHYYTPRGHSVLTDLTTRTFQRAVTVQGKVTLVAVCAGACPALTARALAAAARLLRACGVPAAAARLDARRHDLPWQYTPDRYPAVIVFPPDSSSRPAESVTAPRSERVSAAALVALALRALPPPSRVRVRLALCTAAQANTEKKRCLRDVKEHVTTVIGRNLKYWRRFEDPSVRKALLERLQRLHQVSFDLSLLYVTDLRESSQKFNTLQHSLTLLAKKWEMDASILRRNSTVIGVRS